MSRGLLKGLALCFAVCSVSAVAQNTFPTTGDVGIGTASPLSPLSVSGQLVIGTPYRGDASLQIDAAYGCCGRMTQISPPSASQNSLNIMASSDSSGNADWFSWGVNGGIWSINPGLTFNSPSSFMITGAGNVLANGLMLNYPLPVDDADSVAHNYKIATLYPGGVSDYDHLHLLVTVNNGWNSVQNAYIDATFANRSGFAYQYTLRGSPVSPNAKLTAYSNSNGTVDIYVSFTPSQYSVASYTILENAQETVYTTATDVGAAPAGTLVFDSSSASYPPALFIDFNGKVHPSGGVVFSDGTAQTTAWTGVLCGGDYAEAVGASGDPKRYGPGDVLVLSSNNKGGEVEKASEPYSTMVAGVYATRPGVIGRRQTLSKDSPDVPMAMVGIVPTKVSAENGPIKIGDLLVSASIPGYAMKGTDRGRMLGAVIGKAMGSLDSGKGSIEVLVTLQ